MVKLLKLVTGEEVIADCEDTNEGYDLSRSVRVIFSQDGSVGMIPYALFSKTDKISIRRNHVIYITAPDDEVLNAYNAKFGSGIVVSSDLRVLS